ncbi:hypothetical protein [Bacteriovorax sp. DB6_IX]|uniref:hypothetical protein n=1 Tax=Bacteriovorax sp. DB6_IX TaxID=1353530 RepID=UPI000411674A|nr:hypothetical protein [Bacteriovorax sp. DB6_IX]
MKYLHGPGIDEPIKGFIKKIDKLLDELNDDSVNNCTPSRREILKKELARLIYIKIY